MIEKIESFYSPGSVIYPEDALIMSYPFFGVLDAYSTSYAGDPPLYDGLTDGQIVSRTIKKVFHSLPRDISLEKAVLAVNKEIAQIKESLEEESSAGAAFCFIKLEEKVIILQGADCLALWVKKSGEIGITKNEYHAFSLESQGVFRELMEKHQDRDKSWIEFKLILEARRKETANKKYAVLDGQKEIKSCWNKLEIPASELELLICFTDGLIIPNKQGDELAQEMIELLKRGGITAVLQEIRRIEKKQAVYSHKTHGEATALILTF